jgi:dTDP-4-amino-4,6-dideoxygalactose transaminase
LHAVKPPIYVTKPFLPPLEEFLPYLEQIWASRILTNGGPFHQAFEAKLAEYLGVEHLAPVANATIGLIVALQTLRVTGEVITTPYSFAATAHSLLWNGAEPVFVDVDAATCNLDPAKIEAAITPRTSAILPVHCYGTPCDVTAIQRVADNFGLKVIYDAAHAFGVEVDGVPLLRAGDLSVISFHATKMFNTFEGGAIVCPDAKTKQRIDFLKNFGFADEVTIMAPGINGKLNEFQSALGLLQLKYVEDVTAERRKIAAFYRQRLRDVPGIRLLAERADIKPNYSYFPIFIEEGFRCSRDELYGELSRAGVHGRRYFYPLISAMPMYRNLPSAATANLPVANRIAQEVLCLPIYPGLSEEDQDNIVRLVRGG